MKFSLPQRKIRILFYIIFSAVVYTIFHLIPKPQIEEIYYSFNPVGSVTYRVVEKGIVTFPSQTKLELDNSYKASINYSSENMNLMLKTKLAGEFAPHLEIMNPQHTYLVTIDRHAGKEEYCPRTISPLYPLSLRRLFYMLPIKLKPNSHMRKKVCNDYNCQWKSEEIGEELHIHIYCSATTEEKLSIIFSATLHFNQDHKHYITAHGDISLESPDISSVWQFSEEINSTKTTIKEDEDAQKIHTN